MKLGVLPFFSFVLQSLVATYFYFNPLRASLFVRDSFRYMLAFNIIFAGLLHFPQSMYEFYASMVPLPFKKFWVYASGVAWIIFGIGLCFPPYASTAAYGIAVTLILVFPANIACVIDPHPRKVVFGGSILAAIMRLPFQFTFLSWALWIADR